MSLFGDDDAETPIRSTQSSTLFGEEPKQTKTTSSSLFTDDFDDSANGSSPWSMPTPKKAARGNLVKNLLPASAVPESYIDAFDRLLDAGDRAGRGVSIDGVRKLMQSGGLGHDQQGTILEVVTAGQDLASEGRGLGRNEFNVLMALIGLAQEGEELTLDGVDERRRKLPQPSINIPQPKKAQEPPASTAPDPQATPKKQQPPSTADRPRSTARTSFGAMESDPWGSPDMHKGHNHSGSGTNGLSSHANMPVRTTSTFTTASEQPDRTSTDDSTTIAPSTTGAEGGAWGYGAPQNDGFDNPPMNSGNFGSSSNGDEENHNPHSSGLGRPGMTSSRTAHGAGEESVTVSALPEKEGSFLFQHRNYEIASARRNAKVIRRYSDFVWLLDCLHKRYPFRQLPLLPPKHIAINGNHIAAEVSFLEKRRRGLSRFANALVRHPVLSQEQLVVMFFTVPTPQELSVWRKQATISVQEEFIGRALPPTLEDSLPPTLPELFDTVRSGVRRSAEIYINLCTLMERLIKRNEGLAQEYLRFSGALVNAAEASQDSYAIETNDVPLLNEGMHSTAKHLSSGQALLEDEAKAWDEGVLEDLKRQRDCLVSMRDLFDRRDRLARDNIPQLERRIMNNESKLSGIRAKPEAQQRPGEAEKVEQAILNDKQSIVNQHARGVMIKECIRDELLYFQSSQYHISRLHQDWAQERVKYAELQADCWRGLSEEVENMPVGGS